MLTAGTAGIRLLMLEVGGALMLIAGSVGTRLLALMPAVGGAVTFTAGSTTGRLAFRVGAVVGRGSAGTAGMSGMDGMAETFAGAYDVIICVGEA